MTHRAALDSLGLDTGKRARLHRILYRHGLCNGTALFLPYDQGLEHGPRDFFANPAASDPRYILDLAVEGAFNGVVLQIGLAEKYYAVEGALDRQGRSVSRHDASSSVSGSA